MCATYHVKYDMYTGVLDQYFVQRPAALLTRPPEATVIDVSNAVVLRAHLMCAAAECPLGIIAVGPYSERRTQTHMLLHMHMVVYHALYQ